MNSEEDEPIEDYIRRKLEEHLEYYFMYGKEAYEKKYQSNQED